MTLTSFSHRTSARDRAVIDTVEQFGMATTSQILRLWFSEPENSPLSRHQRAGRALKRLHKWKLLKRVGYYRGGPAGGSGEYCYLPISSDRRQEDLHTLDITELYVRLVEAHRRGELELLDYLPERAGYETHGATEVHPDAKTRIRLPKGTYPWYIEIDRGTKRTGEFSSQLGKKMREYVAAVHQRSSAVFPRVLFVALDADRAAFIQRVANRQEIPELFIVVTEDKAVETLGA
jgi:hypothetical protein